MKKFQRKFENFVCKNCHKKTKGDGYTNHCPFCLYSLHVDINPGDRAADCSSLMKPVWIEKKKDAYAITHECIVCGHKKKNKISPKDDFDEVIKLMKGFSTNM